MIFRGRSSDDNSCPGGAANPESRLLGKGSVIKKKHDRWAIRFGTTRIGLARPGRGDFSRHELESMEPLSATAAFDDQRPDADGERKRQRFAGVQLPRANRPCTP